MNIADTLRTSARRLPDKPALIAADQLVTYGTLDGRADRVAGALLARGLEPGDRVGVMIGNQPAWVETFYGVLRAGGVVVPVNTSFTAEEAGGVLADADVRAVVVDAGSRDRVGGLTGVGDVLVAGTAPWERALATAPEGGAGTAAVDDQALAVLQYTSGTTGTPKGAMLTHAHLLANQRQMRGSQLRLLEHDVVLGVLPLFHIFGLNVALGLTVSTGATLLLLDRFDPIESLDQVVRHRASVLIGVPPMFAAWLDVGADQTLDLASVRCAVSGAAALPPDLLERFTERFAVPLWEGYGLTETAPAATTTAMRAEPLPGSVGRPLPDVELRITDGHRAPVEPGEPGEVELRGPNVFAGYWRQPDATAEVLDQHGWFATGDIGYLAGGDLYLVDRSKDLVIVSGFNVYPREVEDVLRRHPAVADAAVVAVPHDRTGEAVKAVVVRHGEEPVTAADLQAFCREHLARFKCPEVVTFADSLPRMPTGKVRRRLLRDSAT